MSKFNVRVKNRYMKNQWIPICIATLAVLFLVAFLLLFIQNVHFYGDEAYCEPTCTLEGYRYRVCKLCGYVYAYDYESAKGHVYSDWTVRNEPETILPGYGYYKCKECYNTVYDYIDSSSDMSKIYLYVDSTGNGYGSVRLKFKSGDTSKTYFVKLENYFAASALEKPDYCVTFYSDKQYEHPVSADILGYGTSGEMYLLGCGSDASYARNAVSCELWSEMTETRNGAMAEHLRNNGAGKLSYSPILLYYNGAYSGVYTLGEVLGADTMALDGNGRQAMLYSMTSTLSEISDIENSSDMLLLYSSDGESDWVESSFNNFVDFLYNTDGEEFVNGIRDYLDVDGAIDYMLLLFYAYTSNNTTKNVVWTTLDGKVWSPSPYKLEASWGLRSNGAFSDPTSALPKYVDGELDSGTSRILYDKLLKYFSDDVFERCAELRKTVLSPENVIDVFDKYMSAIDPEAYVSETSVWPNFPNGTLTGDACIDYVKEFIDKRYSMLDEIFLN